MARSPSVPARPIPYSARREPAQSRLPHQLSVSGCTDRLCEQVHAARQHDVDPACPVSGVHHNMASRQLQSLCSRKQPAHDEGWELVQVRNGWGIVQLQERHTDHSMTHADGDRACSPAGRSQGGHQYEVTHQRMLHSKFIILQTSAEPGASRVLPAPVLRRARVNSRLLIVTAGSIPGARRADYLLRNH
jgi:hypothetical protein